MTFPYPHEVVAGALAPERLRSLRASGAGTPVILGGPEEFERLEDAYDHDDAAPEALIAEALALDPVHWLEQREQDDPEYFEIEQADWPEDVAPNDGLSAHLDPRTREPRRQVVICTLPDRESWKAACRLKIGGWNEMPDAPAHSALWRLWQERYGAEVACIADDVIEFTVERPPGTRDEALALARQQFVYCADIVHQGADSVEALAATLLGAKAWFFWWD